MASAYRPRRISAFPSSTELDDIHLDHVEVDPEVFRPDQRIVRAEVPLQRIDRLVQGAPSAVVRLVRPEEREDLLARDAGPAGRREERQHGKPPRLRGGACNHVTVREDADAA